MAALIHVYSVVTIPKMWIMHDIYFGVFCISINPVKVLNNLLQDYVCQGICVLD